MKILLKLLAAFAIVAFVNGCASTGCNNSTTTSAHPASSGPTISGYVDTSVGARW